MDLREQTCQAYLSLLKAVPSYLSHLYIPNEGTISVDFVSTLNLIILYSFELNYSLLEASLMI